VIEKRIYGSVLWIGRMDEEFDDEIAGGGFGGLL